MYVWLISFTFFIPLSQTGFIEGSVYWDDEDNNNKNEYHGTLPDGEYGRDTKIYFCCRTDGFATNAIILPTSRPFVLFMAGKQCQYVKGMNVKKEYFAWDTEDLSNKDSTSGSVPSGDKGRFLTLNYCYYYR